MYLGIEIGGTKLQLAVGPGDGTLAALWRGTVDPAAGADGIRRQITTAVPELLTKAGLHRRDLKGVGIGFGGPVDDTTRTVIKSHQIEGWDNFPLADWISDLVELPATLGNDADVAGLAEALFGAGKGLSPIFYITIGSGIGGGLIINGEIYRGCGRGAAEIGHVAARPILTFEELVERNFAVETVESWASGWAIQQRARSMFPAPLPWEGSLLDRIEDGSNRITAADVGAAAQEGDSLAIYILEVGWRCLADAICHVIALLCPRRIVIGGGVSLMGEKVFFAPLRQLVAANVFRPFADCYDIVPAALGEEVVVHGALALARRRLVE
jgi:glucokinase